MISAEATPIGGIPAADMPMDGIPMDAMSMEGVKVAAVSPVEHIIEAATPAPTAPIEVPAGAGPLPLREAAATGDAKALFEVATRYAEGRGMKSDMAEAAIWYERSAEAGLAPAQYRIGNMYEKAIGVERDIAKSRDWYEKAAEQGNASAMHNLAVLYAMGAGGQTDNDAAAMWFVKAAELGVKDSQFNLGILSAKGVGVKQSLEESYKWFALVAKTGDKDAATKRDEIANALRPEQLERARAATELWKPKALDPQANTVDIPDAWQEGGEKTASVDMKTAVQNIQAILNKNGYDAGNADGVMGGKTKTAIAQFQKDNGLEPTGEVDEKLVRALVALK
jgi:localization factor PodJL